MLEITPQLCPVDPVPFLLSRVGAESAPESDVRDGEHVSRIQSV
jgi:hypothetical protein